MPNYVPITTELISNLKSQQQELASQVKLQPLPQDIKLIAGCDSALIDDEIFSVFVIFTYPELIQIEVVTARADLTLPYIPGFLGFREIPNILTAFAKIQDIPDIIMVDGHGIAHPRKLGIAAHLGVLINIPTVGIAKSRLVGSYEPIGESIGDKTDLIHKGEKLVK